MNTLFNKKFVQDSCFFIYFLSPQLYILLPWPGLLRATNENNKFQLLCTHYTYMHACTPQLTTV